MFSWIIFSFKLFSVDHITFIIYTNTTAYCVYINKLCDYEYVPFNISPAPLVSNYDRIIFKGCVC